MHHPLKNASLAGAKVGELDDDQNTWGDNIVLNGLDYKSLAASAPVNAAFRVAWLGKQVPALSGSRTNSGEDFRPQPWRHLQRVFENMGHTAEAREVGIAFERKLRDIGHIGQPPQSWWSWTHPIYTYTARSLHWLYGRLTGFGYRPMQLLIWFLAFWLICAFIYWYAASQQRVFGPSNPLVFQNDAYFDCRPDRGVAWRGANPGQETPPGYYREGNWYLCDNLREEYTGFSPLAYSLDLLMPLVDLQQESDWAPLVPTPKQGYWDEFTSFGWKHFVRLVIWLEILVGWGISLLMVAIVSGLARRSE
ncbi:membrane-associated oxidoreductase [Pseudomonas tructae]|uniref:Membrane-associated oxidoreductase n=1 Tax=Pseudomonas tructae TaxID=2518644 RepID=A0A411MQF0_9PSED|nr:membrane-associated oxidoreductase [Pseudomonas tructae]